MTELASMEQSSLFAEYPEINPEKLRRFLHTGKIVTKSDRLCAAVARALLNGCSMRRIAREFQVGRESIHRIMEHLEATGKLRPLKERLAADWMEIACLSVENLREKLLADEVPANVLFLAGATATDKHLLLTGSATVIYEQKEALVSEESLKSYWANMLRLREAAQKQIIDVPASPAAPPDGPSALPEAKPQ